MADSLRYRVAADIGGTFTDVAMLARDGKVFSNKTLSTPDDYSRGVADGVQAIMDQHGISSHEIDALIHATTVATNTILEYKGARTGLITTEGFRDVLEMRRLRVPVIYDLRYRKPPPLVPRRHRFELAERLDAQGNVILAASETDIAEIAEALRLAEVDAVAICLLHAYANPEPEKLVTKIVSRILGPNVYVCRSSAVLPEIREYERTSTTVVNAYIGPVIGRYLRSLSTRLADIGIDCPIQIMHSAGGVMSIGSAIEKPAHIVESGPAAGVIASARVAQAVPCDKVISFDMGGTTAKAALVENGYPSKTTEYEVGAGINLSSKLVKGGGYPIKLPFIDVSEIGAGGGSIIAVEETGRISVGPESAGAQPGPVAYGLGGTEPTLTDALAILGYVNPKCLVGGEFALDVTAAQEALREKVALPLEKPLPETAHGVLVLAVATMTRAIKAVSTYQGRDPREFTLVAFGGNGPVVASEVARALEMRHVLIPPAAGVLSAVGLLYSDVEHELVRTVLGRSRELDVNALAEAFSELVSEAQQTFAAEGYRSDQLTLRAFADLRYSGQAYELTIPTDVKHPDVTSLKADFVAEHARTYGHTSDTDPIDIVSLKLVASAKAAGARNDSTLQISRVAPGAGERPIYFGPELGEHKVPVISRSDLTSKQRQGPIVVEEYDSTCVVPPFAKVSLDNAGNIAIELEGTP